LIAVSASYKFGSILLLALFLWTARPAQADHPDDFFESRIRPILVDHCYACHTVSKLGGLQIDSREGLLKGGKSGPAIVPGKPEESLLIRAVRQDDTALKMPLGGRLTDRQIADLTVWVKMGAPWKDSNQRSAPLARNDAFIIASEHRGFWAFRPLKRPPAPSVENSGLIESPIDRFIVYQLQLRGLKPVKAADRRTLIRRASFDLIGLPPAPEEVEAFLNDSSPNAFANLVDRLLASPHYGERWGRYWLDVSRYGEDDVRSDIAVPYPNAWRYRDWVVKAFNEDMPYDLFVKAQVAGDLLTEDREKLAAGTGFFGLGPWYYDIAQPPQARSDERNDRVDALSRGFLGLTVACARCHNHKYDPISMEDYYALAGVFASSEYGEYSLSPEPAVLTYKDHQKKVKRQESALQELMEGQTSHLCEILAGKTAQYLVAAWKVLGPSKVEPARVADAQELDKETLEKWIEYLKGTHREHHFLEAWNQLLARGGTIEQAQDVAAEFQESVLAILAEKKGIDEENRLLLAQAKPKEKPEDRFLPNAFVTYDDYCSQCRVALRSMAREKFILWSDLFAATMDKNDPGRRGIGILCYKDEKLERFLNSEANSRLDTMRAELEELKKTAPPEYPYLHCLQDSREIVNLKLHLRGSPYNLGDEVPRRFLTVLSQTEPIPFHQGSGRLELAEAISSHPLAARVMVNRIWHYHFGRGIVGTPSNFGQLGERPTHPELLEYLSSRFRENSFSVKALHREIMLSTTYQLSSDFSQQDFAEDPDNRLLWRANRRRLDAEALRDSILFASGSLDPTIGGPSVELNDVNYRRTIYSKISRFKINALLRLFDFPDPSITSEQRTSTNVPLQGLFFLNSDLVSKPAQLLASRLSADGDGTVTAVLRRAYRILYGREATESEVRLGTAFLQEAEDPIAGSPSLWQQYVQILLSANEFIFVN
jgi:mono/diheme cytochrome c family protein